MFQTEPVASSRGTKRPTGFHGWRLDSDQRAIIRGQAIAIGSPSPRNQSRLSYQGNNHMKRYSAMTGIVGMVRHVQLLALLGTVATVIVTATAAHGQFRSIPNYVGV